ncbi:MAG: RNA 2'-phosphotransferase [Thermoprotei archaeon]|nr:MAG: RNA 2'-phosphotransferase [Thermoprotei archaeon]
MKNIYRCRICGSFTEEPVHCNVKAELFLRGDLRLRLSKLISGLLRHYPQEIGLNVDKEGWVDLDELVHKIKTRWRNKELYQWVTKEHVIALALLDPKGRFELKGNKIRARYGHSIDIEIKYPIEYPPILYHGTSVDRLKNILREGLKPMKRRYVHLTTSLENAIETGRRHGKPVVLRIDVTCLKGEGVPVYKASDLIYLAPFVPSKCISIEHGFS